MLTQAPEAVYYPGFRYIDRDEQMPVGALIHRVLAELAERLDERAAQGEFGEGQDGP